MYVKNDVMKYINNLPPGFKLRPEKNTFIKIRTVSKFMCLQRQDRPFSVRTMTFQKMHSDVRDKRPMVHLISKGFVFCSDTAIYVDRNIYIIYIEG